MKNQVTTNTVRITIILSVIAAILFIPLIAMQFTTEVNWDLTDFIAAGALLLGAGLAIEVVFRTIKAGNFRTVLFIVILLALFLVWAELAVGVFGSPFAGS